MSDQLLKAGLVTEEQVKKAKEQPKKRGANKNRSNKKFVKTKMKTQRTKSQIKQHSESSDLEKFYKIRANEENKEKQALLKKKREDAQRKKEMNAKVNKLISDNTLNDKEADIRYNFVVGTTIKYVFVNKEQQELLGKGVLAITFLGGNRCIIPAKTGREILDINPKKIVIITDLLDD